MAGARIDDSTVDELHRRARAARWGLDVAAFARALERGVRRAFPDASPTAAQLDRHFAGLHLEDLALACACADGSEAAWEHFVREYRPVLYRAAGALDPSGGARDVADSLYAELYGLTERDGQRRSHMDYFHGRSSLPTWLRAVLAQRHVDRARHRKREEPLPDEEAPGALPARETVVAPERQKFLSLMRVAIAAAVARLAPRERLRLACYYAQHLTLAEIGRALGEHEATVSRQLARARTSIRADVERQLRHDAGLSDAAISECFASVADDAGPLDVSEWLGGAAGKELEHERSK